MALVFLLLPGMVAAGLLAPEVVKEAPAEQQKTLPTDKPPLVPPLNRPPLVVPRDFSSEGGSGAPLMDTSDMFRAVPTLPGSNRIPSMVAFPQNRGELIAFDESAPPLPTPHFEDMLADPLIERVPVMRVAGLLPLGHPLPRTNGLRFDDFPGSGLTTTFNPIPEPRSGTLVALGLLVLAALRRRA